MESPELAPRVSMAHAPITHDRAWQREPFALVSSVDLAWLRMRLRRRARSHGLDPLVLEEALQEACIQVWRHPLCAGNRPWMLAVSWNACRRTLRERSARHEVGLDGDDAESSAPEPSTLALDETRRHGDRMDRALGRLDPFRREVVRLHYFEDLSVLEIARRRQVTRKKIRWALESALLRIRSTLLA